eukprot:scaffold8553_cov100-Isochrysis_galbana.AAC.3
MLRLGSGGGYVRPKNQGPRTLVLGFLVRLSHNPTPKALSRAPSRDTSPVPASGRVWAAERKAAVPASSLEATSASSSPTKLRCQEALTKSPCTEGQKRMKAYKCVCARVCVHELTPQ